ncbi:MAG: M20 family metallopeptidase [Chloroflexota bacterium]
MDEKALKAAALSAADALREELTALSLKIHEHPEPGFHEVKAAGWLSEYLKTHGFEVRTGLWEMETAFRARYGKGEPVIALLAEYDALPKLGHACGHNLIAASSVGAAVALKKVLDTCGGTVMVLGTPAEELYGGKIMMAQRGAFTDVTLAMEVHPGVIDTATTEFLACQTLEVEFFGRAAHAAARPERGINALEAMLLSFAGINALRQHIRSGARIHGIITDGGEAPNIVPSHSAGSFIVRAEDDAYLQELQERVLSCFQGAAAATGARLEYHWGPAAYAAMRNNMTLARLFRANMQSLGRRVSLEDPGRSFGSSDMGNVSQLVPAIHPSVAVAPKKVLLHSPEFAQAAASGAGMKGMMDALKAMALTVVDLLASPDNLTRVREEFFRGKRGR